MTLSPAQINAKQAPIGIFDSGVGGLSILRHIREQLPGESLCYFADSGFAPYGDKTEAEVIERTFFAVQYLLQQGVKAIIVACNTATTIAIELLRSHYPDFIFVGVEPGLRPAAALSKSGIVGVLATSRTLASPKYRQLHDQIHQETNVLFIHQACPGLVTQIELGDLESRITLDLLNNFLQPILAVQADTIVLGCTHYSFVGNSINRITTRKSTLPIQLVDTGVAIAGRLKCLLEKHSLSNCQSQASSVIRCSTSGNREQFKLALIQLLHLQPEHYAVDEINSPKMGCNLSLGYLE
ncbi:MAG: murI [Solimicrobium sp.]|nr:murI [Solimicrobium sp.]